MKLAVPYPGSKSPIPEDAIDEYNILFSEDSKKEKLLSFLRINKNKRVNVSFNKGAISAQEIVDFFSGFDNLYVRIHQYDEIALNLFRENNIKYFFDRSMSIYSYLLLDWCIKQNPTDVYIADDLCYNIKEVSELLHKNGISLRIILNRCPITNIYTLNSPIAPIYSPQDIDYLSIYYDVAEFDCVPDGVNLSNTQAFNWNMFETLYKRWFIKKEWTEDLSYINKDIYFSYLPNSIPKEVIENKLGCRLKCMTSHLTKCSRCERYAEIGKTMATQDLIFYDN